eukprot:TRINITY_DN8784_c0_g1_i1.p1 TRINITY_DN8784_c0_g1~~TRINITY_DN8784_c0_g1_i1.p1  ORF type:complete len:591 (-),score=194.83 TRINITY_DN8784_c0_g1_i1:1250-3022(-)
MLGIDWVQHSPYFVVEDTLRSGPVVGTPSWIPPMSSSSLVALPGKEELLVIGGIEDGEVSSKIWSFSIPKEKWTCVYDGSADEEDPVKKSLWEFGGVPKPQRDDDDAYELFEGDVSPEEELELMKEWEEEVRQRELRKKWGLDRAGSGDKRAKTGMKTLSRWRPQPRCGHSSFVNPVFPKEIITIFGLNVTTGMFFNDGLSIQMEEDGSVYMFPLLTEDTSLSLYSIGRAPSRASSSSAASFSSQRPPSRTARPQSAISGCAKESTWRQVDTNIDGVESDADGYSSFSPPRPRWHASVALCADKAICFGGEGPGYRLYDDVYILRTESDHSGFLADKIEEERDLVADDLMGRMVEKEVKENEVDDDDPDSEGLRWMRGRSSGTLRPAGRHLHAAAIQDGKSRMIMCGGWTEKQCVMDGSDVENSFMWSLDVPTMKWTPMSSHKAQFPPLFNHPVSIGDPERPGLAGHSLWSLGEDLMVVAGGLMHGKPLDECWMIDLRSEEWIELEQSHSPLSDPGFETRDWSAVCGTPRKPSGESWLGRWKHSIAVPMPSKRPKRRSSRPSLFLDRAFVFGGISEWGRMNDLWEMRMRF